MTTSPTATSAPASLETRPGSEGASAGSRLGAFLRSRRAQLQPTDVGLPVFGRRRVPGLRREELAIAAGVSPDHYQRIEQGRVHPSPQVLDALADALGFDDVERHHLHNLATQAARPSADGEEPAADPQPAESPTTGADTARLAAWQSVLDGFTGPAFLLNHRRDVLAWNTAGADLICDFAGRSPQERNMAWLILTDPDVAGLYPDRAAAVEEQVALLRRAAGLHPRDAALGRLIGRLRATVPEFDGQWQAHRVRRKTHGTKTLTHPRRGTLTLTYQVLHPAQDPDLELFLYTDSHPRKGNELPAPPLR